MRPMHEPRVTLQPSGATRLVGLLGGNLEHSRSIELHNRAFAHAGLDWQYVGLPVRAGSIAQATAGLAALGFRGANVTMPYKESIVAHLDELTVEARAIGAVNTVRVASDGALVGANTDARGFVNDLREHGVDMPGRAHLIGAGGAARAVAYALAEAGCGHITLVNRTERRAASLASRFAPLFPRTRFEVLPWPEGIAAASSEALVVNCTCVGMEGTDVEQRSVWPDDVPFRLSQVVYDLVYAPVWTPFLRQAEAGGASVLSGLGMLVHQAALAFSWWTDTEAPIQVMEQTARMQEAL